MVTDQNSIKECLTYRSIFNLAIPAVLSSLLNNLYRIIDQYSVQWLGTDSQAALGACAFILIAFAALFLLVSGGVMPLMGRAVGSNHPATQRHIIRVGGCLSVVIGVLFSFSLYFGADRLTILVGLEGHSQLELIKYLKALGTSGGFLAMGPLIDSIFIATGDTKTPLKLQIVATSLNAILNYLLIYQFHLGIAGAAYASGLSRAVSCLWGIWLIQKQFQPQWSLHTIKHALKRYTGPILKIGGPIAIGVLAFALVYWLILKTTITPLGAEVVAALGVGFSALEGMTWPIFAGIMAAVSSLTGRLLGSGYDQGLEVLLERGAKITLILGLLSATTFSLGAPVLCALFTEDPIVLREAIVYAQILAYSQLFVAFEAFYEGILNGSGHTRYQVWLSFPLNFLRVPLAYGLVFYLDWGSAGVWWAINLSTLLKTVGKGTLVYRRAWKKTPL